MSEHVKDVSDSSFEKDVLSSGKPVLVDFWAEWCAPCRMLAPTVAAVAEHYGDNASVVKLKWTTTLNRTTLWHQGYSDTDPFPRRKRSRARCRRDQ